MMYNMYDNTFNHVTIHKSVGGLPFLLVNSRKIIIAHSSNKAIITYERLELTLNRNLHFSLASHILVSHILNSTRYFLLS